MKTLINFALVAILANAFVPHCSAQDGVKPAPTDIKAELIAPDIKAAALWDGRKVMPFKALDGPTMVAAKEANFLDNSDYVLASVINGEPRAYPTRFIWWHHVVNDTIGKIGTSDLVPFAITYCSVCNTGIRYQAQLNGKPIKLDFYGLYNGVVTLMDRETESVFLQAEGRFVKGPLTGQSLKMESILDTTWGEWKSLHPDTLVMSPQEPFLKRYSKRGSPEPRGYDKFPAPFFKPSVARGDLRMPPFDKMLGVFLPASPGNGQMFAPRAYPIKAIESAGGVLNDVFDGKRIVAFLVISSQTANAFEPTAGGKVLTFEAAGIAEFRDKQTESTWNIEGLAIAGPLAGKQLKRLENHLSQWYGWSATFPQTSIYGNTDPLKPVNPFDQKP